MATRGTMPVQSEPYTKGYYLIWGMLSLAAITYIGYLAVYSGQSSIIKISKVKETSGLTIKFREQSKRLSTAMSIASQARDQTSINSKRLNSIEKRVQLITWKLAGNGEATGVAQQTSADDRALAYEAVKQVIGNQIESGGIVGSVIQAPSYAKSQSEKISAVGAAAKIAGNVASVAAKDALGTSIGTDNTISSIAGIVDRKPLSGSDIFTNPVQNLGTLNPLKVAAAASSVASATAPVIGKISQGASPVTAIAKSATGAVAKIGTAATAAIGAGALAAQVQKVALHTPLAQAKKDLVLQKPPFTTMPLPVRKAYGVRLTSGKTVEALRLTWDLINEMNRPILKGLSTRFIEGPSQVGMPYRLIAGPMRTTSQAQALCAKLHKQYINCDVTVFQGRSL